MSQSDGFLKKGQFPSKWFEDFEPIVVSVCGPVSQGKTSVLRTLLKDDSIGSVGPGPITMKPEGVSLYFGKWKYMQILDTPGWEFSIEVASKVREQYGDDFGVSEICSVVETIGGTARKDLRAWKQVRDSNVVLVVFNEKMDPNHYQDDINLLSRCGVRKVAIVNFTNNDDDKKKSSHFGSWCKALLSRSIETIVKYDAHEWHFENEKELFTQIASKMDRGKARELLNQIAVNCEDFEKKRMEKAAERIVKYLIEVVSTKISRVISKPEERKKTEADLLQDLESKEMDAHEDLVETWNFESKTIGDRDGLGHCDKPEIKQNEHWFGKRVRKFLRRGSKITVRGTSAIGIAGLTRLVDTVCQVRRRGKALDNKHKITIKEKPKKLPKTAKQWGDLLDEVGGRKRRKRELARSRLNEWVVESIRED